MIPGLNLIALVALVLASYLAALNVALMSFSRHSLERRLEARGRAESGKWLAERLDLAISATALLRTAFRLSFFALVLVDFTGIGPDSHLQVSHLIWSGLIALALLWLFSSVLSNAIARHANVPIISGSMPVLKAIAVVARPLKVVNSLVDEAVRRLTGANLDTEDEAEAQLLRSIEESHLQGGLDEDAATLLENVVEFGSTDVGEVMTPRTDIDGIELTDDLPAIRKLIIEAGHSRIPVYQDNLDTIVGILYVKDLVPFLGEDASGFKLEPLLRKPIMVPETKPVRELLSDFQRSEVHMAIVIDEYGGTAGLATIEDVLEEIVGEIHDEHEPGVDDEPTLSRTGDTTAEVDGRFRIDELNEQLDLDLPEEEEYDTIAGFMLSQFGRVPDEGESFESHNARFTAAVATPTHIQKAHIELLEPTSVNGRDDFNGK